MSTEINKKPVNYLPFINTKFLCKFVGYFDEELKKFYLNDKKQIVLKKIDSTDKKPKIIIVARKYYTESHQSFPIVDKKELNKILNLENIANNQKHFIWGQIDGQSQVNTWLFHNNVPSAFIQLPESLLLSLLIKGNQFLTVDKEIPLYIARKGKAICSSEQSNIINSSKRFILSSGLPNDITEKIISNENYTKQLILAIKKLNLNLVFRFIKKVDTVNLFKGLGNLLLPVAFVFVSYLMISSAYLNIKKYNLDIKVHQQQKQITRALNQQVLLDKQTSRHLALIPFLAEQQLSSPLWLLVIKLMPDVYISNIRTVKERYVIRGKSSKATDVLATISKYNGVKDAKFDYPTRSSRGLEIFVIGFSLQTLDESAKKTAKVN